MPTLKKKAPVLTPETKLQHANINVEAQLATFHTTISEVNLSIAMRNEAIEELEKEVASLEATLRGKRNEIETAKVFNEADTALIARMEQFVGVK